MERFFRSLKNEWIPPLGYSYFAQAQQDVAHYMYYYNSTQYLAKFRIFKYGILPFKFPGLMLFPYCFLHFCAPIARLISTFLN